MIERISISKTNMYLIKAKVGYILIDAGIPGKVNLLQSKLAKKGISFDDIKLIIITHVHYDHVGMLQELQKLTNAKILVHKNGASVLQKGSTPFPKGTNLFGKLVSKIANTTSEGKFTAVKPDIIIEDDYDLNAFGVNGKVIHTPGHTSDSVCILLENQTLLSGDTFFNIFPGSIYPPFANNEMELIKSWQKISKLNFNKIYPGHGKMITKAKFIGAFERLKR